MQTKYIVTLPLLLIILYSGSQLATATMLNFSTDCNGATVYFCTLNNLSSSLDDPLVISNSSALQISELVLHSSRIGRLPRNIFLQLPNLRTFIMHNCGLNRLDAADFKQALGLKKISIQRNRLFDIPDKTFAVQISLEELQLGHNTLHMLHRNTFEGLALLKYLDLQQNTIRSLPDGVFSDLISLEHIDLSRNEIENINAQTFINNTLLTTLLLSDNKFTVFEPNALAHFPRLRLLDLSNSLLDELNVKSVDTLLVQGSELKRISISESVSKLNAANNQLTGLSIGNKLAVRELELHGNLLMSLDDLLGMLNLQHLDVSRNKLRSLGTNRSPLYLPLPSITFLNLASNQLQNLTADSFLMMQKLNHLDLAFNHLLRLNKSIFEPLLNLEKLYIEGNSLHSFDYEGFSQTHTYLREVGLFDNDWEFRYMRQMINYLKGCNIKLPVRFTSSSAIDFHTTKDEVNLISSTKATHHRYAAMSTYEESISDVTHSPHLVGQVSGIHPYWTMRDVMALATLFVVILILLLQFYNILQEEQCLAACLRRLRSNRNISTITQNRPQRLSNEDDSEV